MKTSTRIQYGLLALGGVAFIVAGPMHPSDSGTGSKTHQLHEMLLDPAWYPAHSVMLLAVVLATVGLWAIHRDAAARMQTLTKVVAIVSSVMVVGTVTHLLQPLNADGIADGNDNAMSILMYFVEPLDGIVAPPMPEGVETRRVTRDQYRVTWDAMAEAFRDHWGEAEWVEEDWERWLADPDNEDPRFWRVGWEGDQVAGVIVTTVPLEENERYGRARVYVASVSVRRPWRRRGLARSLLASSLVAAREAGYTSASLDVDTNSPTGATDLYRSLGFEPEKTFIAWRKPLP